MQLPLSGDCRSPTHPTTQAATATRGEPQATDTAQTLRGGRARQHSKQRPASPRRPRVAHVHIRVQFKPIRHPHEPCRRRATSTRATSFEQCYQRSKMHRLQHRPPPTGVALPRRPRAWDGLVSAFGGTASSCDGVAAAEAAPTPRARRDGAAPAAPPPPFVLGWGASGAAEEPASVSPS